MPKDPDPAPPLCDRCGAAMTLVRITPKTGPLPELHTFRCEGCRHVVTREKMSSGRPPGSRQNE